MKDVVRNKDPCEWITKLHNASRITYVDCLSSPQESMGTGGNLLSPNRLDGGGDFILVEGRHLTSGPASFANSEWASRCAVSKGLPTP